MCYFFKKITFETLRLTGRKVIIKPLYVIKANKIPREKSSSFSIIYYKDTSFSLKITSKLTAGFLNNLGGMNSVYHPRYFQKSCHKSYFWLTASSYNQMASSQTKKMQSRYTPRPVF